MSQTVSVECHHIKGELMRVKFAHSQIVSDHPAWLGGDATGPSPGELLQMAIAASTVFSGREHAAKKGLALGGLGARLSMATRSEGFPEALQSRALAKLTFIDRMWRLLEIEGQLSDQSADELAQAMILAPVAVAVRNGIAIDEELVAVPTPRGRGFVGEKNPFHMTDTAKERLPAGEAQSAETPQNWRVSAVALDDRSCLAKSAGSLYAVGRAVEDMSGPTPEELLLGSLASCTTVFIARNAALLDIPVDSVVVTVSATLPDSGPPVISRVNKVAQIGGDFTSNELDDLGHVAFYCAVGETIKRGVLMSDHVETRVTEPSDQGRSPISALASDAPRPDDDDFCNDGSCCVPEAIGNQA